MSRLWLVVAFSAVLGVSAWRLDTPWKAESAEHAAHEEPTLAERARDAELRVTRPWPAAPARREAPALRQVPPAPTPAPAPVPVPAKPLEDAAMPGRAAPDSRLDADLRQLEEEAALEIDAEERRRALGSPARAPEAHEEWRRSGADAFLVDRLVQEALHGTEYPLGYPALEREIDGATARVTALDVQQRRDLLEVLLLRGAEERIAPRFSSLRWEGAAPNTPDPSSDGR